MCGPRGSIDTATQRTRAVCGTASVDVDRVQSIREAPHRRLDPTNLRTLCRLHHNRKAHDGRHTP